MHYDSVEWFPDGHQILFTASEPGHPARSWTYDLNNSDNKPTPITPEGVRATGVSPDQRHVVRLEGKHISLSAPDGATTTPLTDLEPGESVARWSADGRSLFFRKMQGATVQVTRFEVTTHRREPWRTLKVPEQGANFFGPLAISADGKATAASFQQDLADLYLVKGLK